MSFKKPTPVLASFSVAGKVHFIQMLLKREGASLNFLESVSDFTFRNTLVKGVCCPRCLKAHLLRKAREEKSLGLTSIIHTAIPEEAGHHGYYFDGEEMRKV